MVLLQSSSRWFCISVTFPLSSSEHFLSVVFLLVVALESLRHEQLPEVLRSEFLHVLAVVVNLPCWRVATCIHAPTHKNTNTRPQKQTYIHMYIPLYTDIHKQARAGGGEKNSSTAKHQISGEQGKRKDQNVVRRRRRAEWCETRGVGVAGQSSWRSESINFKLM